MFDTLDRRNVPLVRTRRFVEVETADIVMTLVTSTVGAVVVPLLRVIEKKSNVAPAPESIPLMFPAKVTFALAVVFMSNVPLLVMLPADTVVLEPPTVNV